jgi:beta-glucanase (GH16 family)
VWPAFWLIGASYKTVGWPAAGELDVMEVLGGEPTVVHQRVHMSRLSDSAVDVPFEGGAGGASTELEHPLDSRAHLYGVYFDGSMVRFYIDRHLRMSFDAAEAEATGRSWPFGQPQRIVLNVAVGGMEDPTDTAFPRSMTVGTISVWHGGTPF